MGSGVQELGVGSFGVGARSGRWWGMGGRTGEGLSCTVPILSCLNCLEFLFLNTQS